MPRPKTGGIETRHLSDGSLVFDLRIRFKGQRRHVVLHERSPCECCGGGWDDLAARRQLSRINAEIEAEVWQPPTQSEALLHASDSADADPLYAEYAATWRRKKEAGVNAKKPLDETTLQKLDWRLGRAKRFFAGKRISEIKGNTNLEFRAHLLLEAKEIGEALDAGADLRDERNRRIEPLSLRSMQDILNTHASLLDEAVKDSLLSENTARDKAMKLEVPKPKRTFLEPDELVMLLEAARDLDPPAFQLEDIPDDASDRARQVGELAVECKRPVEIASELGLSKPTVTYHLRNLGFDVGLGYAGRHAVCATLAYAGPRVSELCDLKVRSVRLHDRSGQHFAVDDSKTETGIREVQISPDLGEILIAHIERLRREGYPTGATAYLFPNLRRDRSSRQRIWKILGKAAADASKRMEALDLAPLPTTTPHTLRRTYVSLALVANEYDLEFVKDQVGHADSSLTLEIYNQLMRRRKRDGGVRFDSLVRGATEDLNVIRFPHRPTGGLDDLADAA
jgi:integrase